MQSVPVDNEGKVPLLKSYCTHFIGLGIVYLVRMAVHSKPPQSSVLLRKPLMSLLALFTSIDNPTNIRAVDLK